MTRPDRRPATEKQQAEAYEHKRNGERLPEGWSFDFGEEPYVFIANKPRAAADKPVDKPADDPGKKD